ncbi:recombinase family protein [Allomesorhizobium alhagi]|uniref:Resolvase family site-specific recombinase n=1 Tax=Mesorhizobium alhagi CCNWXJ12-2 TaxID=1107882 RepID=H0HQB4_9HYPH|nr:recombinase family protein [Mesorhizobium alhagi]EHK57086.1 resolvase family site-specific recombinase [Mesorhizobium alhagi CCNWXJ12-2]
MKQCFGYVRVSTQKQGEGVSLDAQRNAIEQFAARNDIAITEWFEEKQTAAKGGRPVFGAMLKALRRRKAAGVVMHKIDRSARNFADWAKIGDLADAGIDVHFASESLDFRSRGGRLSADIQAVIAADYIRNLREETIKGITGRLGQGLYPFRAPIGYLDNGGGKPKTPDPNTAPLIRKTFDLYASGQHSLRSLRSELERLGLRNMHGKPLSKRGIETILNNPFYCGIIRIKRTGAIHQGVHEPLISAALFERVQLTKADKTSKKVTKHNHTYRGLFRCAECDAAMTPELQKSHVYYRCQTRGCPTKCVREEELERAVHAALSRVRLTDEDVAELTQETEVWCKAREETDLETTAAMQLAQIDSRLDALTDALVDRVIDNDTYSKRKERLLLEKARISEELKLKQKQRGDPGNVRKFLELVKNLAATFLFGQSAEKREIVEIAISNRRVLEKYVSLEPANWLRTVETAIAGPYGAPHRPTSRSRQHMRKKHVVALIEASKAKEARKLHFVLHHDNDNDADELARASRRHRFQSRLDSC